MRASDQHRSDLLGIFANHRVAPNLLMVVMIIVGLLALKKHNVQFFPNFELDVITIDTTWSGASAEDVERGITIPLEQRLRNVDFLKKMTSTSASGVSGISLEFDENTNISESMDQVKKQVDDFVNLPGDAELPRITQNIRYESVARLLLTGPENFNELRHLANEFETQLLARGIDKVELRGLPDEAINISVGSEQIQQLGLNLNELGSLINNVSQDLPGGQVGQNDASRELRSLQQKRSVTDFEQLAIVNPENQYLKLGDIATINRKAKQGSSTITSKGQLAAILVLRRNESGDSLQAAEILQKWLDEIRPTLPPNIQITLFKERWQLIKQRIMLLVKNGAGGLALVLLILYMFLSARVAFWVAVGIPVSFMATLAVLYAAGGSINMISLFALIMALGIIVDDAIVVGEDAQAHFDQGEDPLKASEGGARRMFAPVMASSLTTIAAFLPLVLIGGHMGKFMIAIPMVIVSVIIASLIESFLILPGHLRHAFVGVNRNQVSAIRRKLDFGFIAFRDLWFRPLIRLSLEFRFVTLAIAIAMLIFAFGLFAGGRLGWQFFPSPESTTVNANIRFVSGTAAKEVDEFLLHLEKSLTDTINEFDEQVVDMYYLKHALSSGRGRSLRGERLGSIYVELTAPDSRQTHNREFIKAWRKKVMLPAGVENFTIAARRVGPSSRDIDVRLYGSEATQLKLAALEMAEALKGINGISAVDDDLPYGLEQLIFELNPAGVALGLSTRDLAQQLRAAYDGVLIQRFQQGADEVEVRLQLPEQERRSLASLDQLPIKISSNEFVPLSSIADWHTNQGFESLRHSDGKLAVSITAGVDSSLNNTAEISTSLLQSTLPKLASKYGITYSLEGRAANQKETLSDMTIGVGIALALMYIVLAWVFSSYGWPLLVMLTIPLGLTGAILGHWLMGMNMTLLSLFGFFGLSGIVVNDSIILVTFYRQIRQAGMAVKEALIEAGCQRLRAVLLTSLTTIAGLTPLLFETSRQAQFLIPMATSIAFGLAYATLLILFVIPALLSIYEDIRKIILGSREFITEQ